MNRIILYCPSVNSRLDYAARYIFENLMGLSLRWVSSIEDFAAATDAAKVFIGDGGGEIPYLYVDNWILHPLPSNKILSADELENKWKNIMFPAPFVADGTPSTTHDTLYTAGGASYTTDSTSHTASNAPLLNFDIFSAVFFLLSRYEECRKETPRDSYGRFPATSSYLYKKGELQKPVINIWVNTLREKLQHIYPMLKFTLPQFEIIPTIDIDHGFLVENKPLYKQIGGLIKYPKQFNTRLSVLLGLRKDPFFNLEDIVELHRSLVLKSKLFFHCANYKNGIDSTNTFLSKKYVELLKKYRDKENIEIGLHLSYYAASSDNRIFATKEKLFLEDLIWRNTYSNRCHFLMLKFPQTYRTLELLGFINDYTLGYADCAGFRAGCCTPFHWYDVIYERKTSLKIFPLTCMDTTFSKYLHCTEDEAFEKMIELREKVRIMNGVFIPLF
ncbi:MAG: polysaccharide deacetylase family protein, partial [Bacteroidales bacterium]|nr:polysaccharide deacetylase family protein [Bacteroidales bacterium]